MVSPLAPVNASFWSDVNLIRAPAIASSRCCGTQRAMRLPWRPGLSIALPPTHINITEQLACTWVMRQLHCWHIGWCMLKRAGQSAGVLHAEVRWQEPAGGRKMSGKGIWSLLRACRQRLRPEHLAGVGGSRPPHRQGRRTPATQRMHIYTTSIHYIYVKYT